LFEWNLLRQKGIFQRSLTSISEWICYQLVIPLRWRFRTSRQGKWHNIATKQPLSRWALVSGRGWSEFLFCFHWIPDNKVRVCWHTSPHEQTVCCSCSACVATVIIKKAAGELLFPHVCRIHQLVSRERRDSLSRSFTISRQVSYPDLVLIRGTKVSDNEEWEG
jgi:hypothetical protein